jgi:hypothetical protein
MCFTAKLQVTTSCQEKCKYGGVAHKLAQQAMPTREFVVMKLNYPECVTDLVKREVQVLTSARSQRQMPGARASRCNIGIPW